MNKTQALIRASAHYLTDPIPEEFFDWNEQKQNMFLTLNAWQPFEEYPPEDIYQCIDDLALDMMNITDEKKPNKLKTIEGLQELINGAHLLHEGLEASAKSVQAYEIVNEAIELLGGEKIDMAKWE